MLSPFSKKLCLFGTCFYTIVTLYTINTPFFWDTILTSTIAQWFYDHNIQNGIVPLTWDAGHPPLFQIYLSTLWNIFGKSLAVSHLAMLPFLIWSIVAFISLLQILKVSKSGQFAALLLYLLHPYILTQSTLISYDILQIAFFLSALIGLIKKKSFLFLIGLFLLSACSVRGQMIACLLILSYAYIYIRDCKHVLFTTIICLAPIVIWNFYHYSQTGWMLSTPSTSWENHRSIASFQQFIKNIFGITRCFVDYGTIALTVTFIWSLRYFKTLVYQSDYKKFFIAYLITYLGICGVMIVLNNPIGHRYFMILHVGMIIALSLIWDKIKYHRAILSILLAVFISGHWWIYPSKVSNGWDVTLRYMSYEKNRAQMNDFLRNENISMENIGSAFPLFCSLKQTHLLEGERMQDLSDVDLNAIKYIAYSPVCNDMKHLDWDMIHQNFEIYQEFGKGMTSIMLFKNKSIH